MKHARHRPGAGERIFLQSVLGEFKAQPGFSGSGYLPLTMRMAGNPNHSSQTLSRDLRHGLAAAFLNQEVGIDASTCSEASIPMGPSQACGAIEIDEKFAMAATFQSAVMPPTWFVSV